MSLDLKDKWTPQQVAEAAKRRRAWAYKGERDVQPHVDAAILADAYLVAMRGVTDPSAVADLLAACEAAAHLLRRMGGANHDPEYSQLTAALRKATGSPI